eukprot:TRINITY_DN60012_c0_g1_i1.p1 TRINITY_DN60012_c0_g1~~TRINITY_DN60012_c0_g1_i1.p1  ORF type:complete len:461 (-),score=77.19 TRINITY_DN60012_c0_g1_i1:6-1388(-)
MCIRDRLPVALPSICQQVQEGLVSRLSVTAVCGGSGAELIGFSLALNAMAQRGGTVLDLHVRVLDHFAEWGPSLELYTASLASCCSHLSLQMTFEQLDMLVEDAMPRLREVVMQSDVCTLFYALSELYDRDLVATERFVQTCMKAAQEADVWWVCADPASIQHEKPAWFDAQAAAQGLVVRTRLQHKMQLSPSVLAGCSLNTSFEALALRIGHDVKTFCNFWCRVYGRPDAGIAAEGAGVRGLQSETAVDRVSRVLVVLSEASIEHWERVCVTEVGCTPYRLQGSVKDASAWQRMWRQICDWEMRAGILMMEHRHLADMLLPPTTTDRGMQVQSIVQNPSVLVLDLAAVMIGSGGKQAASRFNVALGLVRPTSSSLIYIGDPAGNKLEQLARIPACIRPVSYTHLRAHETPEHLVCRLLLEKKKKTAISQSTFTLTFNRLLLSPKILALYDINQPSNFQH